MRRTRQTPGAKLRKAQKMNDVHLERIGELEDMVLREREVKNKLKKIIKDEIGVQTQCKETEYYSPKTVVKRLADALITSDLF